MGREAQQRGPCLPPGDRGGLVTLCQDSFLSSVSVRFADRVRAHFLSRLYWGPRRTMPSGIVESSRGETARGHKSGEWGGVSVGGTGKGAPEQSRPGSLHWLSPAP